MGRRTESKRSQLQAWLAEQKPALVDPRLRQEIGQHLAPVSPRYLRELLRASGVPLHPLVEGVRQDTIPNLERTLAGLAEIYRQAQEKGDTGMAAECRRMVIEAKEHAKLAALKTDSPEKEEVVRWALVWLENPGVFVTWARLRRRAREQDLPAETVSRG